MTGFYPSRRFLRLPAWVWIILPPALALVAKMLGPPGALPERPEITAILHPAILVTRDGNSFRFVPLKQSEEVKPLWAVSWDVGRHDEVTWAMGWDRDGLSLGFYKMYTRRSYRLAGATQFGGYRGPDLMTPEEVQQLRPLVVAELNRRSPNDRLRARVEELLKNGMEETSYRCVQNAVILLAWLSLGVALLAVATMFFRPRSAADSTLGRTS